MKIDLTSRRGQLIVGGVVLAIMVSFFALKLHYEHSSEKHCGYISREVSDLGPPEKVCPRVCERHHVMYDASFSYLEKKLGTECSCCAADAFGGTDTMLREIP